MTVVEVPVVKVAHRGASAVAPENTVAAVRRAVADGADLVEVDVRCSRDGVLVLMHDATLARTVGRPDRVADLTARELAECDAGATWRHSGRPGRIDRGGHEPVPTLAEAAALAPLLVDVKDGTTPGIVDALAAQVPPGVLVQSREPTCLRGLKERRPDLAVCLLGRPTVRGELADVSSWADGVHPHHLVLSARYVAAVHAHGMHCLTWTVNSPVLVDRAVRMGVDGVITDRPGVRAGALRGAQTAGAWCPNGTRSTYPSAASTLGRIALAVRR